MMNVFGLSPAKSGGDCPHVGASDEANEGVWVSVKTGQKITYQGEWGKGEPNDPGRKQNCLCLHRDLGYKWNDGFCGKDSKDQFICEKGRLLALSKLCLASGCAV